MSATRAIFVSSNFPSRREAERGSYNLSQLRALRSGGLSFEVLASRAWFPVVRGRFAAGRTAASEEIEGFSTFFPRVLYLPLSRGAVNGWLYAQSLRRLLVRRVLSFEPGFLWSSFAFPDGVGLGRLAAELGLPHVMTVVGSDLNLNLGRPARRAALTRCVMNARLVLAKSRALSDSLIALGVPPEKVVVDYNGVDTRVFRPGVRAEACLRVGAAVAPRRILFVGSLVPVKNVPVLLGAFDRLVRRSNGTPLELVLVGDGFLHPSLLREVGQRGLGGAVRFLGVRPHGDIATWLAASDVLCLPSRAEGVPNVVLEALAGGRPVVASAVGGIPEVHPGAVAGALVPPDDEEALAAALGATLAREWDPRALSRLVEGFSWTANARRVIDRLAAAGLVEGDQAGALGAPHPPEPALER